MAIKYTKWPYNIQYDTAKTFSYLLTFQVTIKYTNFSLSRLSKIYPNWNFGMKINHLAILHNSSKMAIKNLARDFSTAARQINFLMD
jgi:hypothetical protein